MEIYRGEDLEVGPSSISEIILDYQTHQRLFQEKEDVIDLPQLYQLSDFYQGASFLEGDVQALKSDLEAAILRVEDPIAVDHFSRLAVIAERAIADGSNLFAVSE